MFRAIIFLIYLPLISVVKRSIITIYKAKYDSLNDELTHIVLKGLNMEFLLKLALCK